MIIIRERAMGNCESEEEHMRVEKAKKTMPSDESIATMGARFKVISEPSRLKILLALEAGEMCVEHIMQAVGGNQSAVSHQLKTLRDNKIIKSRRSGQNILYSVADWHIITIIESAREHLNCD